MFNTIKESFNITNKNIIIATPLIFFSLLSSLYLIFSSNGSSFSLIISAILFFLMLGAFLAGWFMMITKAVKDSDIEDNKLIVEFPAGVGEYFLPILGMIFKIFIISAVIMIAAYFIGKKFVGNIGIPYAQILQATGSIDSMKEFVSALNEEQLIKINLYNLIFFFAMIFNYFILMFYPAAIFFKRKNPFIAFWIALKDTFSYKFFKNAALFTMIFITYFIISLFMALMGNNIIIHFILTLLNFYYVTFIGVLIFNYYYSNFAKIGSNVDTTV